ncbi:carbohydrate ABC transporter permease [Nakamurella sp. PAMC28650]|uniref:carbohydrate ABC transporter permease n=1 Tax=Nakamurella sp. PAMC28650 TaxID=2762325 RepID=UPI00164DAAF5|nr:carbohydrate ABC transporter permease [Nakamurella sp. PAMC28650]QNK81965.1 carbohydrate ABC transporter permease [Nakamurella sp. PAMC28650]
MRRSRRSQTLVYGIVILWVLVSLAPVVWMLLQSIKPSAQVFAIPPAWLFTPSLQNYRDLFSTSSGTQFGHYLMVSLTVTISTVLLTIIVSVPASYALTFMRVRRPNFWLILILLASMLPPVVLLVPLFQLWNDLHLLDNPIALILTYTAMNIPFTVWLVRGFMAQVPRELRESALVDGAGDGRILLRVMLPVVRSGIAAAAIFTVISAWNELLFAVLLTTDNRTAPAGIVATLISDRGINWGKLYAAATMVAIPIILFTIAVQRHVVRGFTFGAVKG